MWVVCVCNVRKSTGRHFYGEKCPRQLSSMHGGLLAGTGGSGCWWFCAVGREEAPGLVVGWGREGAELIAGRQ